MGSSLRWQFQMRRLFQLARFGQLVTVFAWLASISFAQTIAPTITYKLQAQKEWRSSDSSSAVLYLAPDHTLLAAIPQQNSKWLFKRITAWETGAPKEETLTFATTPFEKREALAYLACALGCSVPSSYATINVDPEQHIAVFRIKSESGATNNTAKWTHITEIVAIDLRKFAVTTQLDSTDPLWAKSDWASMANKTPFTTAAGGLPGAYPESEAYAKLAGPTCRISGASADSVYMLYDCRTAYVDELADWTTSRKLVVLKMPDGRSALEVRLPRTSKPYPALLANAAGHTWLLLLRDGINLEIYRVHK